MSKELSERTIDWQKVESFIRTNIAGLADREMEVKKFTEGYSNLTYMIKIGEWEAVLRRPPFGYTPPKAHDMHREYKIIEKVHPVFPLAPKPYFYCENSEIMDKHFYVMEKRNGVVIDKEIPSVFKSDPKAAENIPEAVISALVQLHSIDVKKANLENIGKPEGYLTRQVYGWMKRHKLSKTDDAPNLKEIEKWLTENIPVNDDVSIVHNDFKLNNMMFDSNHSNKVVGVFDWELATIGDPLTDLGSTLTYWIGMDDPDLGISSTTANPGFYTRREFLERYSRLSGKDVSNVHFYLTFGFYKLAGILQQLYYRWKIGEVKDERFAPLNKSVANLIEMADQARRNRLL